MLRAIKQIPTVVGYFRGDNPSAVTGCKFITYPLKVEINSFGVVAIQGNNIFFDTYTNAQDFITAPDSNGNLGTTVTDGDLYRDMGQTINIFVGQYRSDNIQHVATLTKVQRYTADGQTTEGVTGKSLSLASGAPPASNNYFTGYLVTWSSNPAESGGIPVGGSRTGYY